MEYLCPLCNNLVEYIKHCSRCGKIMNDKGRIQDYYDDYSPYLGYNITNLADNEPKDICQHIFTCPHCENDELVDIRRIIH